MLLLLLLVLVLVLLLLLLLLICGVGGVMPGLLLPNQRFAMGFHRPDFIVLQPHGATLTRGERGPRRNIMPFDLLRKANRPMAMDRLADTPDADRMERPLGGTDAGHSPLGTRSSPRDRGGFQGGPSWLPCWMIVMSTRRHDGVC